MSTRLKVLGGTTKGSENLCRTCRYGQVARGTNNEEYVNCQRFDRSFTFQVAECNQYENKNTPTLYEMEEIAWRVVTKGSRVLGFVDAKEWAKRDEK